MADIKKIKIGDETHTIYPDNAVTCTKLWTNNDKQAADSCYKDAAGVYAWRYGGSGVDTTATGDDGIILSWSWNTGSVGGQIYLDDNPNKTMKIRGYNGSSFKTWTTWSTFLHSDNYTNWASSKDHLHDDRYYTESEVSTLLDGKSNTGHTHTKSEITDFAHSHDYLPLSGGTLTGELKFGDGAQGMIKYGTWANTGLGSYPLPSLGSAGIGIFARPSKSTDEGGLIVTEDTCMIFNSADLGWSFQVHNTDLSQKNFSGTDGAGEVTRVFGIIDSDSYAWSRGGYKKDGSSNDYVLLGGGGHKAVSDFLTSLPSHTHTKANITDFPTSLPASDVYAWAKASTKPSYTYSEVGAAAASHTHTWANINTCIEAGNEFNFVPSGYSQGYVWVNYAPKDSRTGLTTAISSYYMANGKATGGFASVKASTFYKSDGTEVSYSGHTHSASDVGAMPIITINRGTSTDFNANNMTDDAFYRPSGDVGSGNQYKSWTNFPTSSPPAGGFGLLNFIEGGYRRQIYGGYYSNKLYSRYQYYNSGTVWSSWDSFAMSSELSSYLPKAGGAMSSGARISASGGNLVLGNSDNAGWVQIQDMCSQSGTDKWTIRQAGSATFASTVSAAGGFFESSDERLKDFGEDIQVDLNKLKTLKKKYFKFKGSDKVNLGVSAQEIQEIYPEIVMEDENGTLQVDYAKLSVIALKAIDVLQEDTDKRLKRIEALLNL